MAPGRLATAAGLAAPPAEDAGAPVTPEELLPHLCGQRQRLSAAPPPDERHGLPVRRLLAPLSLVELPAEGHEAHDVDEWRDLDALDG